MNTELKLGAGEEAYLAFSHALLQLLPPDSLEPIAVAVSGGADSMCLCLLMQRWASEHNRRIIGLTVDHLLRPESTGEALKVHTWLKSYGIEHHILPWHKTTRPKNLQESARKARYELLENWCENNHVPYLALAHNQDDQIETLFLRLAHNTSSMGLAGIPDSRDCGSVTLIRPLLSISRRQILETLENFSQEWIEDPSNRDDSYTRIKIRQNQNYKAPVLKERLLRLRNSCAKKRMELESKSKDICDEHLKIFPEGYCVISQEVLKALPRELLKTIMIGLLQLISGKEYAVGTQSLDRIITKLFSGRTLSCHGCLVFSRKGELTVCREAHNIKNTPRTLGDGYILWDNRFKIKLPSSELLVKQIGNCWLDYKESEKMISLPQAVRPTLPGIWEKETLLNVPHLSYDSNLEIRSDIKMLYFHTLQFNRSRFIFN